MSIHSQLARSASAFHASHFGDCVHYTEPDGSTSDEQELSHAIVGVERTERQPSERGVKLMVTREVTVITDPNNDLFCGVQNPLRNATVRVGEITYQLSLPMEGGFDGQVVMKCVRTTVSEMTREGYRGKG